MAAALIASLGDCALAQPVPDSTLGSENSRVTPMTPTIDQINGGATRGANLFHSFQEFNVGEGRSVYFTNPAGIENILTRVTGTNLSNILGTLGVRGGNANLFLINPNGIIFGPNARLDVGGSFVASTASSIKFADGTEFSAVNPSAPPLLTISVPIGLQFNGTEGNIVVQGSNQTPAPEPAPEPTPEPAPDNPFTEVGDAGQLPGTAQPVNSPTDGTTFNAISGNLDNGNDVDLYQLFLTEGQPFTASTVDGTEVDTQLFLFDGSGLGLSSNDDSANTLQSTVPLNEPFTPAASGTYYLGISSYNNDPRSSQGYIFGDSGEPTGPGAGLPLSEWIANDASGSGAYTITLNPQPDSPTLNPQPNPPIPPREALQVQPGKTLALVGGNVTIQGGNLQAPGGRVELGGVAGSGTVGLNIDSNNIDLSFPDGVARADVSLTNASVKVTAGNGGSIAINAQNLDILGNSDLAAGIGEGLGRVGSQAGDIMLNATGAITIRLSRIRNEVGTYTNTIGIGDYATGNGGDININAGSLLLNGAHLSTSTFGQGNGGSVLVQASGDVSLAGGSSISTDTYVQGNAGSILVQASDDVSLADQGSSISTSTDVQGNGGSILVQAGGDVSLAGGRIFSFTTGQGDAGSVLIQADGNVFSNNVGGISSYTRGQGNGGSVSVQAGGDVSFTDFSTIENDTYGQGDAGGILLQANGDISFENNSYIASGTSAQGEGKNVSLRVNGDVSFVNGSYITSNANGQGDAGSVSVQSNGNVSFSGRSRIFTSVETEAEGKGGDIQIQARSLSLTEGAQLIASTLGQGKAGDVIINARDTVSFDGVDSNGVFSSAAFSSVQETGVGNGGDINITTGSLRVSNGAQLIASTLGQGKAGNMIINARDTVSFDGGDAFSDVEETGVGNGGNINITTGSLTVSNGAQLIASTLGQGKAGDVIINARDTVSFDGVDSNGVFSSAAFSSVQETGVGNGGDINITTGSLRVSNGAQLSASTSGQGKAGSVIISARDTVAFDGVGSNGLSSGAFSSVRETGVGNGGDINITTESLRVSNGAVVSARTRGQGNGGNITVHANTLEAVDGGQVITTSDFSGKAGDIILNVTQNVTLSGSDPTYSARLAQFGFETIDNVGSASGVFANTLNTSTNRGGDLTITTGQLNVRDGAEVSVSSQGAGNAGSLRVEANSILLDNGGKLRASTASGFGGNIELQVQDLILMRLHSLISANAENNGNGGNVTINAPFIVAVPSENSDIIANAEGGGRGGNINITTQGIYGLEYRPQLTPNSDINASSRFGVNGTVQINTLGIDPSRGLANLPTEVVDASNQIAQTCGARGAEAGKNEFIVTGRRGMPSNPYEPLSDDEALEDIHPPSELSSRRNSKPVAARSVSPQSATSNPKPPIVEAQGWVINDKGQVVLTATPTTATPHDSWLRSATCPSS
jgi:filamentous hemagglutinin family protein